MHCVVLSPGPHPPFLVTPKMENAVANKTFPAAADNKKSDKETCVATGQPQSSTIDRCDYGAEIENLDRLFQLILNEIDDDDDDERDTIVCFASDHGEMLGDHGDSGKTFPWQGSASVPMICKGPGIREGGVVERPVATLDLAATFLDYAKSQKPKGMTSTSLRSILENDDDSNYRKFVSSGLQSVAFNESLPQNSNKGYAWRMVVCVLI